EKHQQHKRNPVVPLQYKLAGQHTQAPADKRRQGFDSTENQTCAQRFRKFWFMECGTFSDGSSKSIHGHAEGEKQGGGDVHTSVQTGRYPYDTSLPPVNSS